MKNLLALLACLLLVPGAFAQKGGHHSSSSSSKKSSSSKSSSTSGAVHVRGYTRKDGTYVQPHYRSRPDGLVENNWSYKGNVNPFTGKLGTKDYPLGVWLDAKDRQTTYNTPFSGINADYESKIGAVVSSSTLKEISTGSRLTHYRTPRSKTYAEIESWHDLSGRAMDSGDSEWWFKGQDSKGKPFESKVSILPAQAWSGLGPDQASPATEKGVFVGLDQDPEERIAKIGQSDGEYKNQSGGTIKAMRRVGGQFVSVESWKDIKTLIQSWSDKEVILKVVDSTGTEFFLLVSFNSK